MAHLLRHLVAGQDRQNELLEELLAQLCAAQKQRASELGQWKSANPHLARSCRVAAESLGKVQTEFLEGLTQEINDNYESLLDGEFMLNEFVDRFGPRMAHLNGLLQILSPAQRDPQRGQRPQFLVVTASAWATSGRQGTGPCFRSTHCGQDMLNWPKNGPVPARRVPACS